MTEENDEVYIERVKQGDLQAYTYLVDKYKNMAFNIALKLARHTEDAEDAVQESFIKAYHKLDTFEFNSKFSTWLYRIVYRTTAYNLRKNVINGYISSNRATYIGAKGATVSVQTVPAVSEQRVPVG